VFVAQVSNVEVYYKAISFYLAAHPSLLVDMLKVRQLCPDTCTFRMTCTILQDLVNRAYWYTYARFFAFQVRPHARLTGMFQTDLWPAQVLESRVDHTRVVHLLRKADNLPLVKDYLLSVQKSNLAAVNEAVNELLVEEDNFEVCALSYLATQLCWGAEHESGTPSQQRSAAGCLHTRFT
jgi:hypothetical protein